MTEYELSNILKEMYETAKPKEKAVMIHLFGIKYADELQQNDISIKEVLNLAHIPETYYPEINKCKNLSKYVDIKPEYR
ncbi:MAG: hypothetical protein U0L66_09225 [Acutalibacteraceae bacterium]|nr:hypothetical protein [Acutalibacteraceae bacterium]